MVSIPFGISPYQLCIALLVGAVFSLIKLNSRSEAASWGGKSSLLIGGVIILFSWSQITFSLLDLVSWVLSGWLAALIGYEIVSCVHSFDVNTFHSLLPPNLFLGTCRQLRRNMQQLAFPGFDGLRLGAAVGVLFCHAFFIAESSGTHPGGMPSNPLVITVYTRSSLSADFSSTVLCSLNPDPIQFTINRTLRLLPGFVFCILVMTFVFGPIVSTLKTNEYLFQSLTFEYVRESVTCLCDTWLMPFAFTTDPNYMYTKNASLWTLEL